MEEETMPIYEYRCTECQQLFEEWCKHVEDESIPHACPICKGRSTRIISNTSFALKGGGWYVTEYGSRKTDGAASSTGTASSSSEVKPAGNCSAPAAGGEIAGASAPAASNPSDA